MADILVFNQQSLTDLFITVFYRQMSPLQSQKLAQYCKSYCQKFTPFNISAHIIGIFSQTTSGSDFQTQVSCIT